MKITKDFEEFIGLLNEHKVRYLVVGGYAFAIHAFPRFTNDIDFFIDNNMKNTEKVLSVLNEFGFTGDDIKIEDLTSADKIIQLGVPPFRIDLLTSIDGVDFEKAFENKIIDKYGDQKVYFIGKDDFIKNKKASGRKKDLTDLELLE